MPTADELLGVDVVSKLIGVLERVVPGHPFVSLRAAETQLGPLALRQRSDLLKDALLDDLPGTAAELNAVVRAALDDARFTGWMIWPVTEAVTARALGGRAAARAEAGATGAAEGTAGLSTDAAGLSTDAAGVDFDDALVLLAELTPRLTAEFAIRPLLQADLARALPIILTFTRSADAHVRRLASEGTRAFLPWAKRVPALLADPTATRPIIDALYRDESEYVRRSVANHLNDLSRESPDLAAAIAAEWMLAPDTNTARLVRHGLRSLIKKGHAPTMALFGFVPDHGVIVSGPVLGGGPIVGGATGGRGESGGSAKGGGTGGRGESGATVCGVGVGDGAMIGGVESSGRATGGFESGGRATGGLAGVNVVVGAELPFSVTLENVTDAPAKLVVDYVVHHRKANGSQTPKVFKLAAVTLEPGQTITYSRRHSFKRITTRVYHPGEHALEVQVNGAASGRTTFMLLGD